MSVDSPAEIISFKRFLNAVRDSTASLPRGAQS